MCRLFHVEPGHLVWSLLVYQYDVLAINFTSLPAEGKVPLLILIVEGVLIFCEVCRDFASDNFSPSVDLHNSVPVLSIRSDQKVGKVVTTISC